MHKTMKTDTGVRLALANPAPTRRAKPALLDLNNNTLDDRLTALGLEPEQPVRITFRGGRFNMQSV
ncbi:MAG: hypothetical protein GY774_35215 [Planctomycetes bacterium]|nr:hypothetical protein [Planctomycetota bacterium]